MKRFVAIAAAVIMILFSVISVLAEVDVDAGILGAKWINKDVYGAVTENTAKVNIIQFNPAEGNNLIPMAYSGNGGYVCLGEDHVAAAIAEGYEVVGAINGSFFEMSTGAPCGTLISDGKLIFTHTGLQNESIATFDINGKMQLVTSTLRFSLQLKGSSVPVGIGLVNKVFSACKMAGANAEYKFHYYDIDAGDIADETIRGYEVICERKADTNLAIGQTLKGNVVEVKSDSYYGQTDVLEDNQFVLFIMSDAPGINKATALEAGDSVAVTVKETNVGSIEAMENAHSGISSAYWLVKDGVDITDTQSTIVHSTSLARAWTVFGTKEDGSYVFWVSSEVDSDGGSAISLKDIADEMINMGCTNVIRLDGGGSTSMFVLGEDFVMSSPRKVCDMLLIVTKDSVKYEEQTEEPVVSTEESKEESIEAVESIEEVSEPIGEVSNGVDFENSNWFAENIWFVIGISVGIVAGAIIAIIASKRKK